MGRYAPEYETELWNAYLTRRRQEQADRRTIALVKAQATEDFDQLDQRQREIETLLATVEDAAARLTKIAKRAKNPRPAAVQGDI
jgi:hypothetical protein